MNVTLELVLRIVGLVVSVVGIAIVWLAPRIVDKFGLVEKKIVDPHLIEHLSPEDQVKYRRDAAILNVKLVGMLVGAPGFIMIMIAFK